MEEDGLKFASEDDDGEPVYVATRITNQANVGYRIDMDSWNAINPTNLNLDLRKSRSHPR